MAGSKNFMKKTQPTRMPDDLPGELRRFVASAKLYDSSSSPDARVYFVDKGDGYYLKCAARGTLAKERRMTEYFHARGFGAEVLHYTSAARDWLLTAAVSGQNCLCEHYREDPKRLCDTLAAELRKLHETDFGGCPIPDRTVDYLATAEQNYRAGKFDPSFAAGRFACRSASEAHAVLSAGKDVLQSRVLLHGDYCLPNIILKDWKLSGFIDVGSGGVGDRHIDLFWGVWTLRYNLKTDRYGGRFLDAYGRDLADESILNIIAAAETFG